ncbi:hypothetical protein BCV71DRAFT_193583 [Rhizopus microsporus]|uniref:Uncharacterized protein n=1 Tax=Rhizopus microsporus TaxID=58291 RepID=A0A1X0SCY1_RHIZD|nr:hypothetical protein BCV71DRAFT_193583 [Rhizopus microsporus]
MSSYLYEWLYFILQSSCDCPSPQVVLLLTTSRLDRSLTGPRPFSCLFQATNYCPRDVSLNLPLTGVCHIQKDGDLSFSHFIRATRIADFFIKDSASDLLRY